MPVRYLAFGEAFSTVFCLLSLPVVRSAAVPPAEGADGDQPVAEPEAVPPRTATTVVTTQVVVTVLTVFAGMAALAERRWLEGRAAWIAVLAAAVLVGVWGVDRRWGASGGALLAAVVTVLVAADLDRLDGSLALPPVDDSLPPRRVYALTLASGLSCLGCLGLAIAAWWRRERLLPGPLAGLTGPHIRRSVGSGLLVAVILVSTVVLAGGLSRAIADRRADLSDRGEPAVHLFKPVPAPGPTPGPTLTPSASGGR